jgi:two-component system OmpR family sensor kinase
MPSGRRGGHQKGYSMSDAENLEQSANQADLHAVLTRESGAPEARQQIHELSTALAARDRFIALLGHELRNAIAPMLLLAEQFASLAADPQASPTVSSRAALLVRNLNRFVSTIDRVAEVADLRKGKLQLVPSATDLVDVVEEVCRDVRREAVSAGVALVIDTGGPVVGRWDRARVKQIISNLMSNAIRYGGAGGRVEVSIGVRASDAVLAIRDHGPGLDPDTLPRLFDGFDDIGARRSSGFGIGLWVVKTLCTAMQGSVTAENCSSGGARFCVVLPRG